MTCSPQRAKGLLPARRPVAVAAAAVVVLAFVGPAGAFQIQTDVPELKMTWDNTVKYSNAFRLKGQDSTLTGNPNLDDGDRNFNKGLISNRLDLLSELDVQYQDFGVRASGAAWYDDVYNKRNDNDSPFTANQTSTAYNEFTSETRNLHGR